MIARKKKFSHLGENSEVKDLAKIAEVILWRLFLFLNFMHFCNKKYFNPPTQSRWAFDCHTFQAPNGRGIFQQCRFRKKSSFYPRNFKFDSFVSTLSYWKNYFWKIFFYIYLWIVAKIAKTIFGYFLSSSEYWELILHSLGQNSNTRW